MKNKENLQVWAVILFFVALFGWVALNVIRYGL